MFRIRPASVHDAESLRTVHAAALPEDRKQRDSEWYRQIIDSPGTPRAGTWVSEADGGVAGVAHFRASPDPATCELVLFCLRPDAQGKGLARPLLDAALDDMRTLGFACVRVEVPADHTRARRFCERVGFREERDSTVPEGPASVGYRLGL
jgi:RimJ/RimL family protein N-acetyltransferase